MYECEDCHKVTPTKCSNDDSKDRCEACAILFYYDKLVETFGINYKTVLSTLRSSNKCLDFLA